MRSLNYVLFLLFVGIYADEKLSINLDNVEPTEEIEHTRLIKVDYKFETETVLYQDLDNKDNAPSLKTTGNFSFHTLHYDLDGNILARFEITECKTGPCNNLPPVLVAFTQGGNNLESAYIDIAEHPNAESTWNVLWGIVSSIYTPALHGEGDNQVVPTVFGECSVKFSRPADKKFKRDINNCKVGNENSRNFTRIAGLEAVEYSQEVFYRQNTKVDADIVIIDAIELAKLRNPLDPKYGFQLESRLYVEITNRTRLYVPRLCKSEYNAHQCAVSLKGKHVGHRLYEGMHFGIKSENKFVNILEKYRDHLFDMGDSHTCDQHSLLYAQLVHYAYDVTPEDWKHIILNPENEPVLHVIGNILGSLGTETSLKVAREHLLIEGPIFIDDYLFTAALSLSNDHSWHKQLMYWLNEETGNKSFWKIANAISSILKRKCEESPSSWNECNKGKNIIVNKFIATITNCTTDDCRYQSLNVLHNLPINSAYQVAKKYLCNNSATSKQQVAALRLIKKTHHHQYESQLTGLLLKLFRNTCPQKTSVLESQLATDILIRSLPEQQNIGTHILRTETLFPDDPEKWQYFYKAVLASNLQDELKMEYWRRMRAFKVFRANYIHKSLNADSNANWSILKNIAGYQIEKQSSVEFDQGIFKTTDFEVVMTKGRKFKQELFGLSINSAGVDGFVKESSTDLEVEPEASIRLNILGHALPEVSVFKGTTGMMSAVWNADGQTLKAFEGNVPLRIAKASFPLLSGLSTELISLGATSIKILGSCEISLWNKESATAITLNTSTTFLSSLKIIQDQKVEHSISSIYSTIGSLTSYVDANFQNIPPTFCTRIETSNMEAIRSYYEQRGEKVLRNIRRRSVLPGSSLFVDEATSKQCNKHAETIQQY